MQAEISIMPFLDEEGRITALPKKQAKRAAVLAYLAQKFESGRTYNEKEINQICLDWHTFNDYFLVRRCLVEAGFLCRKPDCTSYWRTAAEASNGGGACQNDGNG